MSSDSPSKKIMYPTGAGSSKSSLPKAHMPKNMSLPKDNANQCLPNNHSSHFNPNQYYSLRWNNYQK